MNFVLGLDRSEGYSYTTVVIAGIVHYQYADWSGSHKADVPRRVRGIPWCWLGDKGVPCGTLCATPCSQRTFTHRQALTFPGLNLLGVMLAGWYSQSTVSLVQVEDYSTLNRARWDYGLSCD